MAGGIPRRGIAGCGKMFHRTIFEHFRVLFSPSLRCYEWVGGRIRWGGPSGNATARGGRVAHLSANRTRGESAGVFGWFALLGRLPYRYLPRDIQDRLSALTGADGFNAGELHITAEPY